MNLRKGAAAMLLAIASMDVVGAAPARPGETHPKALDGAINAGVSIVRRFPAASGLTGWVLGQGGRYTIVYTTADGKTLLAGAVVDERGENLGARYEEEFVPKPDYAAAFQRLEKSAWVSEGTTKAPKSVLYVFVDPNCPYCHLAWRAVQPYETAGLQVRWIPVATLGPTSLPKAIEVLGAADKLAAFRSMEANHGKLWKASAQSDEASHSGVVSSIRQNNELMGAFGIAGTPGIVWRDKQGKIQVKSGMPHLSELAHITGLPEQNVDDPELAKFR